MTQAERTRHFVDGVARFIDARRLIECRAAVVVGVSGGPDSVALLAVLRELAGRADRAYRLTAAHLDHGLRAGSADDAAFVADLARRWHLPCIVERRQVRADRAPDGLEQAARAARYAFLADAARQVGAGCVAVGHHLDDHVETVLHRIVRGTHLRGLAGIGASRPLAGSQVTLVRPLLAMTGEAVRGFCADAGLDWRADPTNADTGFSRNFIRHELLPLLRRRLNVRADEAVARLAEAADEAESCLAEIAEAALAEALRRADDTRLVLDAACLAGRHPAVQGRTMRLALERLGVPLRTMTTQRFAELRTLLADEAAKAVALPGGAVAARAGSEVYIALPAAEPAPPPYEAIRVACPGETPLPDGRRIVCTVGPIDRAAFQAHCRSHPPGVEMLDADALRGALLCRVRRRGDRFHPLGAAGRQSVSNFLTNARLPQADRAAALCLADEEGIVYLAPLRIDERVRVTPATHRAVRVVIEARSAGAP